MKRKETSEELRAHEYLQTLKYAKIEYEPLGNVTPDFVLNDSIAVEVRRLNRNILKDEHLIGMENIDEEKVATIREKHSHWIEHQLCKNIQLVINEKNQKINKNFTLYSQWWLILIDFIAYGMSQEDFKLLQQANIDKHKFSKVIILSPEGDIEAYEL